MNGLLTNGASIIKDHKSNMESGESFADLVLLSKAKTEIAAVEPDDRVRISEEAVEQIIKTKYNC